jgi:arylsulfatase A-like enzyme
LREAEHQNKNIITALEKIKHKKFFAFIHYFDVHSKSQMLPYDAPPPYNGLFTTDNATELKNGFGKTSGSEYLSTINKNRVKLSNNDLEYITALYDNGIAYMDSCIGNLFESFQDMNIYDSSLIIITADHGEEFQEHGYMLHDNPYYHEELIHVPLFVKLPPKVSSFAGKRISSLIELIDIMPSVMEYVNIKPFNLQGTSFIPLITGKAKGKEYVYGLSSGKSLYIRSKKWKLMSDNELKESRLQLFDLEHDPQEHNNVVRERPDIKKMLVKKFQEQFEASRALGLASMRSRRKN